MSTLIQQTVETPEVGVPEKKVWTDEAFMALPDDGHHYEIVNGELIDMGNSGALHGYVCSLLLSALMSYVLPKKLGVILDSSTAFKMKNGNKRSPDISFFAKERLQGMTELPSGFLEGAPDLARLIRILCKRSKIQSNKETASWHARKKHPIESMI